MLDAYIPMQNLKLGSGEHSDQMLHPQKHAGSASDFETTVIVDGKLPSAQESRSTTLISPTNRLNGVDNHLIDDAVGLRSKRLSPTSVMPTPTSPGVPQMSPMKSDSIAQGDGNDSDVEEPVTLHAGAKEPRWSATSSRSSASLVPNQATIAPPPRSRAQGGKVLAADRPTLVATKRIPAKRVAAPAGIVLLQGLVRRKRALRIVKDVRSTAQAAAAAQAKADAAALEAGAHRFVRAVMVAPHGALGERVPSASSVALTQAAADVAAAEAGASELWPVLVETGALLPGGQAGAGALPAHAPLPPAVDKGSSTSSTNNGAGSGQGSEELPLPAKEEATCLCYVADPGDGQKPLWGPGDDSDEATAAHSASGGMVRLGNATTLGPSLPDFRGAGVPANAAAAANSLAACYAYLLANFLDQSNAAIASKQHNSSSNSDKELGGGSPPPHSAGSPVPVLRVAPLLLPDPTGPFSGLNFYAPSRAASLARGSTVGRGSSRNPNSGAAAGGNTGGANLREDTDLLNQQPRAGRFRASLAAITWDALEGAYKVLTPAQRALLAPTRILPQASSPLSSLSSSSSSRSFGPTRDSPPPLGGTAGAAAAGASIAPRWGPPRARVHLCVANDDDRAAFATVGFTVQPAPLLPFGPLPTPPPPMPTPVAPPMPLVDPVPELPRGRSATTTAPTSLGRSGNSGRSPHGSQSRGMRGAQGSRQGLSRGRERAQSSSSSRTRTFSASSPTRQSAATTLEADQKAAAAAAVAERNRELEAMVLTSSEQAEWQALKAKRVSKSLVLSKADKLRLIELRGKLKSKAKQLQESGSSSSHSVGNDFLSASADGWSNVGSVTSHHPSKSGPSVRDTSSNSSNTSGNSTSVPNTATGPRSRPLPFFNHALSNNNPAPAQFEAINEDGPMSPGIAALRSGGPDDDDEDNALRGGRRGVSFQDEKSAVNDAEGMATLPTVSAHARACGLAFVRSRCRVRPYGLLGEGCSSSTPPATSEQKFAHATAEAPPADMTAPGSAGPDPTQESGVCLLEPVGMHKPVGALGAWLFGSAEAAAAHPPRPEVVRAVQGAGHAKHAVYAKRLGSVGHSWRANALEVHVIHAAAPDLKRTRGFSLSRSGSLARSQPGSLARAHSRQGSLARSNPANSSSGSGGGGGGVGMGVCAGSETVSQLSPREGYNEVLAALAGTYRAVLVEFSGSGQRVLRLLPLSSGAQAGPWVQSLPRVTFDALELAFALLPASDQAAVSEGEVHFCLADSAMLDVFAAAGVSAGAASVYTEPQMPTPKRPQSSPTPPTPSTPSVAKTKLSPPCSPPPLSKSLSPTLPSFKPLVDEVEGTVANGGTSFEEEEEDSGFRMRTPLAQQSEESEDRQANPGRPLRFVQPENDNQQENPSGGGIGSSPAPGISPSSAPSVPRSVPLNQRQGLPLKVHAAFGEGLQAMPRTTDPSIPPATTQQSPLSPVGTESPKVAAAASEAHEHRSGSKGTRNSPGGQTRVPMIPKAAPMPATLGTSI